MGLFVNWEKQVRPSLYGEGVGIYDSGKSRDDGADAMPEVSPSSWISQLWQYVQARLPSRARKALGKVELETTQTQRARVSDSAEV